MREINIKKINWGDIRKVKEVGSKMDEKVGVKIVSDDNWCCHYQGICPQQPRRTQQWVGAQSHGTGIIGGGGEGSVGRREGNG